MIISISCNGHAEKVVDGNNGVYHPQKPDKIRVVFDCTATFDGESLNSISYKDLICLFESGRFTQVLL